MKTFYIASSSWAVNVPSVLTLAAKLEQQFGMEWKLDWTPHATASHEKGEDSTKANDPEVAVKDIEAATSADLFIFLVTEQLSSGAHIEHELGDLIGVCDMLGIRPLERTRHEKPAKVNRYILYAQKQGTVER